MLAQMACMRRRIATLIAFSFWFNDIVSHFLCLFCICTFWPLSCPNGCFKLHWLLISKGFQVFQGILSLFIYTNGFKPWLVGELHPWAQIRSPSKWYNANALPDKKVLWYACRKRSIFPKRGGVRHLGKSPKVPCSNLRLRGMSSWGNIEKVKMIVQAQSLKFHIFLKLQNLIGIPNFSWNFKIW